MPRSIHFRSLRRIFVGAAIALLSACAPAYLAPPVNPELVRKSPAPQTRLESGHELYMQKCAKCHAFENPANYGEDELKFDIMPVMARKSKLSERDADAVLAYLLAARKMPAVDR